MVFGAISTAIGNYWLAFFGDFSVWTIGGAVLGYTGYNYMLFGYLHFLVHRDRQDTGLLRQNRPLVVAIAWTGYEYLKSVGFLGYPWGLIGYAPAVWLPVAQAVELAGIWGLTFLAVWINAAIVELLLLREHPGRLGIRTERYREKRFTLIPASEPARHLVAAVAVLAVLTTFGSVRLREFSPDRTTPEMTLRVLVVQQNIDSWAPGRFDDALTRAQNLTLAALAEHRRTDEPPVDFVLWSETSLRRPFLGTDDYYDTVPPELPFTDFLRLIDRPLVTGVPMPAGNGPDLSNSAVVILPDGSITGVYAKQQLVPFAERIPFWEHAAVRDFFRDIVGVYGTWMPGTESTVIPVPLKGSGTHQLPTGLPICFEDGFGWVPREMVNNGANLLLNLTNNSWSRQNSAQTQHYVAARLRSIELRTTLVRGTNSGLSGVVDRRGVLLSSIPMFESAARVMTVPVHTPGWTLYRAVGDLPGQLAVVYVLLLVVWEAHRRRTRR